MYFLPSACCFSFIIFNERMMMVRVEDEITMMRFFYSTFLPLVFIFLSSCRWRLGVWSGTLEFSGFIIFLGFVCLFALAWFSQTPPFT